MQPTVERHPATRRERAADRDAAEVVSEGDAPGSASDQPGLVDGSQGGQPDAERRQQVVGDRLRRARQEVEHIPGVRLQAAGAGQHRVAHAAGDLATVLVEHLGHVEGVAPGELVEPVRVDGPFADEGGDGGGAERLQRGDRRIG